MEPQHFRKKPIVVEAEQLTRENVSAVVEWICENGGHAISGGFSRRTVPWVGIRTLEGTMTASLGDWVIREPFATEDRRFYPCKPDIFEATYEPESPDVGGVSTELKAAADEGMGC